MIGLAWKIRNATIMASSRVKRDALLAVGAVLHVLTHRHMETE